MLRLSKLKFPKAIVEVTVWIRIPETDRGKTDSRNIIAVIGFKKNEHLYKLVRRRGILNELHTISDFTI